MRAGREEVAARNAARSLVRCFRTMSWCACIVAQSGPLVGCNCVVWRPGRGGGGVLICCLLALLMFPLMRIPFDSEVDGFGGQQNCVDRVEHKHSGEEAQVQNCGPTPGLCTQRASSLLWKYFARL